MGYAPFAIENLGIAAISATIAKLCNKKLYPLIDYRMATEIVACVYKIVRRFAENRAF